MSSGQPDNQTPDNSTPLCGTKCQLTLGAGAVVTAGAVAAGGELTKAVIVGGMAAGGESALVAGVTTVGGAVVGKIALDGIADHAMPASGPTDPASPAVSDQPATPPTDNHSRGERPEQANQLKPKRGKIEGDLTQLQKEAFEHNHLGSQEELSAIDYYAERGHTVEKLPESKVPGQTTPDLLVDGELKEIKARAEPLQEDWVKYRVRDANRQFSKSGRGDNPTGSVDLRLKNQGQTDAEVLEQARAQIEREFRPDQYRSVTAVRVFNEGRLIGEWVRQGGKVVRVPSGVP